MILNKVIVRYLFLIFSFSLTTHAFSSEPAIITTSPALTELVFQLGFGKHIIAASNFSDYPDEAKTVPRIGTLFLPNLEVILRLNPNLVLVDNLATPEILSEQLKRLNVPQKLVTISTVNDLFNFSRDILKNTFNSEKTQAIDEVQNFFEKTSTDFVQKPFTFLLVVWNSPVTVVGHSSFLSNVLGYYGGKNILPKHLQASYPVVSVEWLAKSPPEVLFFLSNNRHDMELFQKESKKWWPKSTTKFIFLSADYFARASFTPIKMLPSILEELR